MGDSMPASATTDQAHMASAVDAFIDQSTFHRRLVLPATADHGALTVTYAVSGRHSDSAAPVVLFVAGMMGGRYLAMYGDYLSATLGLRLVAVDRPGMGSSSRVPPAQRLAVWLETVRALQAELGVEHMSLLAHSCGVIYALNTVYAMPALLPPANPTLYLFSPWVAASHSGARLMGAAAMLPAPLINNFSHVMSFVTKVVVPPVRFSMVAASSVSAVLADTDAEDDATKPKDQRDDLCRACYGVSAAESVARSGALMRRVLAEDTTGANGEALLCLRKPGAGPWGVCDDYAVVPALLEQRMREQLWGGVTSDSQTRPPPFAVSVAWAETDIMIGKGGEAYFEQCFRQYRGDQEQPNTDCCLVYRSETIPETDHETLCLPPFGAVPKAVEEIAEKLLGVKPSTKQTAK